MTDRNALAARIAEERRRLVGDVARLRTAADPVRVVQAAARPGLLATLALARDPARRATALFGLVGALRRYRSYVPIVAGLATLLGGVRRRRPEHGDGHDAARGRGPRAASRSRPPRRVGWLGTLGTLASLAFSAWGARRRSRARRRTPGAGR